MQIDEIRANAPDGATHYRHAADKRIVYYRIIDGWSYYFYDKEWLCSTIHPNILKPLH